MVLGMAHKGENTAVSVIGIDPLKAIPAFVTFIHAGIFLVNVQQVSYICLKALVFLLLCQIPVQADLFIPLMKLAEILPHKQQLFARVAEHEGIAYL